MLLEGYSISSSNQLYKIDLRTGVATPIGPTGWSADFEGLAFSPNQVLYAVEDSYNRLYQVDVASGSATLIGNLGVGVSEMGLAFDHTGVLWMVAWPSSYLYRVNTTTGAATAVGSLGVTGLDALAWDGSDLYALQPSGSSLYSIDRTTGAASLVGPLVNVSLSAQSGLTADSRGRLWGLDEDGTIFTVDKSTGEATVVSMTLASTFESLALHSFLDSDSDGMPDYWEDLYGLNKNDPADAGLDGDGDGLTNLEEFKAGTDPTNPDSEGDGMPDGWEVFYGLNPLADDSADDLDGDGLTNLQEFKMKTDPTNARSGRSIPVPTLSPWGVWILLALLLGNGSWLLGRRQRP